ncbi:MAG: transposase, partial [Rhodothermaceae bacterium]|nr:transposase [Rhodothermaceae bacterium]
PGTLGLRGGKGVGKYKMKKFFTLEIREGHFSYTRNTQALAKAAQFDGLYAIRSSLKQDPEASELVTHYKRLSKVEMAFRTLKSTSLQIRPIRHRTKDRVVAHVFLCMLACYVEYHLRQRLAPMLFSEQDPQAQRTTVVGPAKRSELAKKKARTKRTQAGEKALSYASLMEQLSKLSRLVILPKLKSETTQPIVMFEQISSLQKQAFKLLNVKLL